jgi:hypothetical protein
MPFTPFEKITYVTKLTPNEISSILNKLIEESKIQGVVKSKSFKIVRTINYRNSFIPTCYGIVKSSGLNESSVEIKMKLNVFVLIFMSLWMMFTAVIGVLLLIYTEFGIHNLMPFAMFVFGYLITTIGFKLETKKAKFLFKQMLNPINWH